MKVIIADDRKPIRDTYRKILDFVYDGRDVEVHEVDNGVDFHDRVVSGDYSLAITDHNMPGGNGLEAVVKIRKSGVAVPIIMVSAAGIRERALEEGVTSYFPKPFDFRNFCATLKQY
jgi:two-component system, OmpR family, response regulator TctD